MQHMGKQWKSAIIRDKCELKTVRQLDMLHIGYRLPFETVVVDGISHQILIREGRVSVFVDDKEEQSVRCLPYVIGLEPV